MSFETGPDDVGEAVTYQTTTQGGHRLCTDRLEVQLDAHGSIEALGTPGRRPMLDGGAAINLWRTRDRLGHQRFARDLDPPLATWDPAVRILALHFRDAAGELSVFLRLQDDTLELRVQLAVAADAQPVAYLFVPDRVEFAVPGLEGLVFPHSYGVRLTPAFFRARRNIVGRYPGPADFVHLDAADGSVSLFGVQPIRDRTPFSTDEPVLAPGRLYAGGVNRRDEDKGSFGHGWNIWCDPGESFTSPPYRVVVGRTWQASLAAYGRDNHITRDFDAKLAGHGRGLQALREAYIVKFDKRTAEALTATASHLPRPAIVHFARYLPNGFDRGYPTHLPPDPDWGDEASFAQMCDKLRAQGHLVMPYTNYTWWCLDSTPLEQHGDQALQRRLDGHPILEYYYDQAGYIASQWHPLHRQLADDEVTRFIDIGIDVLSVDQLSARPLDLRFSEDAWWDGNPACPVPYGVAQGLHDASKVFAERVPLSTEVWEHGPVDYLANWAIQFCGAQVAGFDDDSGIEFFPLAHALIHDKALMTWHDLMWQSSSHNDRRVSLSLLLGFQLIYVEGARGEPSEWHREGAPPEKPQSDLGGEHWPDDQTLDWITWLHELTQAVARHYVLQPLRRWRALGDNVYDATYGPVRIVANLGDEPAVLDAQTTIAADGFAAEIDDEMVAGLFTRWRGDAVQDPRVLSPREADVP